MIVLNEPSEYYSFSGVNGVSDIDVSMMNRIPTGCRLEWEVKCDWCISDHNVVLVQVLYGQIDEERVNINKKWLCKNVCWGEYMNDLSVTAAILGDKLMSELNVDKMTEIFMGWIQGANAKYMRDSRCKSERKIVWWMNELSALRGKVQKRRRE